MWLKRRRGESADMAFDGKVDENMIIIGFLGTGDIPGLHRVLRLKVLLRMEAHAVFEMSQMGPAEKDDDRE